MLQRVRAHDEIEFSYRPLPPASLVEIDLLVGRNGIRIRDEGSPQSTPMDIGEPGLLISLARYPSATDIENLADESGLLFPDEVDEILMRRSCGNAFGLLFMRSIMLDPAG